VKDILSCDNESLLRKLQTVISEVQVNLIVAFIEKLQMLMLAVQNSEAFLGPLQTMGVKNYDHEKFASLNYKISLWK
jgi:hypothetical protein